MGRGNRELADARSAKALLFGPRRSYTVFDAEAAIASALQDLNKGFNGPALVLLQRYQDRIGQDQAITSLMGQVTFKIIEENLPEDKPLRGHFNLQVNPEEPALACDRDDEEMEFVVNGLSADLRDQILHSSGPVSLDYDTVAGQLFESPAIGSLTGRFLADMEEEDILAWTYRLRDSNSPVAQALRESLAFRIVADAEADARQFIQGRFYGSAWSEQVTYFRRGGNHATLYHLYSQEDNRTLCGKDIKRWSPNRTRRGVWRDAPTNADAKRCPKCEKAMPEDFFGPAGDSENYSLLSRDEYDKLVRTARRRTRTLLESDKPISQADVAQVSQEIADNLAPVKLKALGRDLHQRVDGASQKVSLVRTLIGYGPGAKLWERVGYDEENLKVPTARQISGALKGFADRDSDEITLALAKLFFRANGKTLPKQYLN